MWIEVVGYIGMAFVLISFLFKDIKFVRIINIIGSLFTLVYGIMILAIPIIILDGSLLVINSVYLLKGGKHIER